MLKLNYNLSTSEERLQLVNQILEENENLSPLFLEKISDYLVIPQEKEERKKKFLLTDNRLVTVNKRETSLEGLAASLETGEDGIYELIKEDKNVLFSHKKEITKQDIAENAHLAQLMDEIALWKEKLARARGTKDAFTIKRALIEMNKDKYILKQSKHPPIVVSKVTKSLTPLPDLDDYTYLDKNNEIKPRGISFCDYKVVSAILCTYSHLHQESRGRYDSDTYYFLLDFEDLCARALKNFPLYQRIISYKINGFYNETIQMLIEKEFNIHYGVEYISSLWRKKIPKLIAKQAKSDFLFIQYKEKSLPFKRCSCCGTMKPSHRHFFSINKTSVDGFYSLCKECRNKKSKARKELKNG